MPNANADIFQQIGELSDDIHFIYDVSRKQFQYISPALSTIWGLPPEQVIADPSMLIKSIHPDDRSHVISNFENLFRSNRTEKFQFKIKRADKEERFIHIAVYHLPQENKKVLFAGIAQDATTLKSNIDYAEKINARKNTTLIVLAHDLKGPIGIVNMLASSLKKDSRDDSTSQSIQFIQDLCERNINLINSLLSQEFLESPDVKLRKERIDLIWSINDVIDQYKRFADVISRKFILTSSLKTLFVQVDGLKLMQVFNNLISNAIKFTRDNGKIEVTVKSGRSSVLVIVRDNGIGIPADLQPYLFDKFTRARRPGLRGEETTGLGMAAIKALVELHDGKVWFESEENKGSSFYIELPVN
jgi:two-component system sensor histidine kinase VicK